MINNKFSCCPKCANPVILRRGKMIHDGCNYIEIKCINQSCGLTNRSVQHTHANRITLVSYLPRRGKL